MSQPPMPSQNQNWYEKLIDKIFGSPETTFVLGVTVALVLSGIASFLMGEGNKFGPVFLGLFLGVLSYIAEFFEQTIPTVENPNDTPNPLRQYERAEAIRRTKAFGIAMRLAAFVLVTLGLVFGLSS